MAKELFRLFGSIFIRDQAAIRSLNNIEKKAKGVGNTFKNIGAGVTRAGGFMTKALTLPLAGVAAISIKTAAEFEASMKKVQAISGATGEDLEKLKDKAKEMGIKTKFSATESAEAMNFMALAGWKTKQMLEGLPGVLNLAAASGEDLAMVTDIVTDALTAFKMEAGESTKFADLLANTAANANTNVEMLGESFKYAAPIFAAAGFNAEDAAMAIGTMANAGIKASMSGTSLRKGLTRLLAPPKKAAEAMMLYKLSMEKSDGTMKSFNEVIDMLRKNLGDLSESEQIAAADAIFGKTAMAGWLSIINAKQEDITKLRKATSEYNNAAEKMADIMNESLIGQLKLFQSVLEGIAIQLGDILLPYFKKLVQATQKVAQAFANAPLPVKHASIAIGALVSAIGPLLIVLGLAITYFGGLISVVGSFVGLLSTLGLPIVLAIAGAMAQWSIVIGVVSAAVMYLAKETGLLGDGLAAIKAFISRDINNVFELFTKRLNMTNEAAKNLTSKIVDTKSKSIQLVIAIKNNIIPAFKVLKEVVLDVATGGFKELDKSTEASRSVVGRFISFVTEKISGFVDYFYDLFDRFGLITTKLKYMNDEVALKFVELHSITEDSFYEILDSQDQFGSKMTKEQVKIYDKMYENLKKNLNKEYSFVVAEMDKKKEKQLKLMNDLFRDSDVLSRAEEEERMIKLEKTYKKEQVLLKDNNAEILNILTKARNEKRALTKEEEEQIASIRAKSEKAQIEVITKSKSRQNRILEDSKNLSIKTSKEEALALIADANTTYDKVVKAAKKTRDEKVEEIIKLRDQTGVISREESLAMIREADKQYRKVVNSAIKTKNETVREAASKSRQIISIQEMETREIDAQSKKIKKLLKALWKDIKEELPGIAWDAAIAIGKGLVDGMVFAIKKGAELVKEAARDLALKAIGVTNEELGIESPSTVFKEIGGNVTKGFAEGITTAPVVLPRNTTNMQSSPYNNGGNVIFNKGAFEGANIMDDYSIDRLMDRITHRLKNVGVQPR